MKRSIYLFLLILLIPLGLSKKTVDLPIQSVHQDAIDIIKKCMNRTLPLNYRGKSLISNSDDSTDQVLCLGDAFGDLNETYVIVKDCYLAMYHKDKMIWSSKINAYWRDLQDGKFNDGDGLTCAISLERDGNLVLYKTTLIFLDPGGVIQAPQFLWDSQTNFNPAKTELRIEGFQVQLVQTFKDGSQRLFYADENHQEFIEDMGEPVKIADRFILKKHSDEEKTILRRNEYIGDLDGRHLILQTNCDLQLFNKSKIVWAFVPPFRHEMNCTLDVAQDNRIEISAALSKYKAAGYDSQKAMGRFANYERESIIRSQKDLEVAESLIFLNDDYPVIIQTLKNGDRILFLGVPGQNSGLSPHQEYRQISQKTFPVVLDSDDSDEEDIYTIQRMDYIGNLTGLHLILEENCSLILANGNEKLWEFQSEPPSKNAPLMECFVVFYQERPPKLIKTIAHSYEHSWDQDLLERSVFSRQDKKFITEFQLTLENDQIKIERRRSDKSPYIFHAGPKTEGGFFRFLSERSVIANTDNYFNLILPKMGYIGDLDGVYTILDKRCNWVLYNRTQVLWESGSSLDDDWYSCSLVAQFPGDIMIFAQRPGVRRPIWFFSKTCSAKEALKTELQVENNELWLTQTFEDGVVHPYKALKGTNSFISVSKNNDFLIV